MQVKGYSGEDMSKFSLWWEDLEEAGVENVFVVADESGDVVGFQSVNIDGKTVAIEVLDEYQGQGIATALVEESGSYKPERNECPDFWAKMEELMEGA